MAYCPFSLTQLLVLDLISIMSPLTPLCFSTTLDCDCDCNLITSTIVRSDRGRLHRNTCMRTCTSHFGLSRRL